MRSYAVTELILIRHKLAAEAQESGQTKPALDQEPGGKIEKNSATKSAKAYPDLWGLVWLAGLVLLTIVAGLGIWVVTL